MINSQSVVGGIVVALIGLGVLTVDIKPGRPSLEVDPVTEPIGEPAEPAELAAIKELLTEAVDTLTEHTDRLERIEAAVIQPTAPPLKVPDIPAIPEPEPEPVSAAEPTLPDGWTLRLWSASWCDVCREWKQTESAKFAAGEIVEIDFDKRRADANRSGIKTLPTFEVMHNGNTTYRIVGTRTAEQLQESVRKRAQRRTAAQVAPQRVQRGPVILRDQWGTYRSDNTFHCGNSRCAMCNARRARRQNDWQASIRLGQEPAPQQQISEAINGLNLDASSVLCDIGCGDGRVLIQAVQQTGCTAVGIEIDPKRAAAAVENINDHGLSDRIKVVVGDARSVDLDDYGVTHCYTFLFSELLDELRETLTRYPVAAVYHPIPGLRPQRVSNGVYYYG